MMAKTCVCNEVFRAELPVLIDGILHRGDGPCFHVEPSARKVGKPHPEVTRLQAELILAERREAVLRQKLALARRDLDNQRGINNRLLALAQEDSNVIGELQSRLT